MDAEFIVVSGALLGAHFPLGRDELHIGRAQTAQIRLSEPAAAMDHCVVRFRDGHYRLQDRRSGTGTYVNGMRVNEHVLEPDDQVSIGETVLVYRESTSATAGDAPRQALLRACSLLFLFRAVAMSQNSAHRALMELQLLRLIGDIVPCEGGAVVLGRTEEELCAATRERKGPAGLEAVASRVWTEGAVIQSETRIVALALYTRGAPAGMLGAWFGSEQMIHLADHRDTLGAVATLAAAALETVREAETLRTENLLLRERLDATTTGIVGESIAIHKMLQMVARVAPLDTSVLILGESGTGKELVAHALHRLSPRVGKPFVAINCAALTETLLESELFGHEKGAFTGAVVQKRGKLEVAEGGTVFLDEIGELAPTLQAKLLRVLQQREFERVGGTRTLKLDIRLIAATNRDLAAEARRGAFREDLYHRLNVVALRVPPLRDRPQDIPPLARYFVDRAAARCGRRVSGISPEAEACLLAYNWPGNVRELENAIERAVVLGDSEVVLPGDLPESVLDSAPVPDLPGALQSTVTQTKRQSILSAWQACGGDHQKTAEYLRIHPNSLRRLIRNLKLKEVLE